MLRPTPYPAEPISDEIAVALCCSAVAVKVDGEWRVEDSPAREDEV